LNPTVFFFAGFFLATTSSPNSGTSSTAAAKFKLADRWALLKPYLAAHKGPILWGWSFVVVSTALDQINPWMIKIILDSLGAGAGMAPVLYALAGILGATAISAVLLFFQRLWVIRASRDIEYALRRDLFSALMAQPRAFFDRQNTGDLMSRATNDLDRIRDMVGPVILHLARMGFLLIFTTICVALLHPKLLLTGLLPALIMPVLANFFLIRMYSHFGRIQKNLSALNGFVQDTLTGIQVVKGFGRADPFERKFAAASADLRDSSLQIARFNAAIWPAIGVLGVIGIVLSAWLGGRMVIQGEISLGTLSAAILYLLRLQFPLVGLGWVASMIQRGNVSVDRLLQLQSEFVVPVGLSPSVRKFYGNEVEAAEDTETTRVSGSASTNPPTFTSLEARGLTFSYNDFDQVVSDLSFTLKPGTSLGIVGATGSGKTTLLHVLCGLYPPHAPDSLRLNGVARESVSDEEWRARFSYAPQDGFLFSTTIRENIQFGADARGGTTAINGVDGGLTLEKAVEWSGLSRDLPQFPNGYDTLLGEKGINLSGGQRQRVGLARALLSPAPILCLDDTLSALDAETEEIVLEHLRKLFRERCMIVVAHRYSAVKHCDEILYLKDGRVSERGTHEELLRLGGAYAAVWEKQRLSESLEQA
jgi:ATP-binding cassette subfamily B multidrug efflux pump